MKENKWTLLKTTHLVLMIVMLLMNAACTAMIFSGKLAASIDFSSELNPAVLPLYGCNFLFKALSMVFGIIYLLKGYSKEAQPYYKAAILTYSATMLTSTASVLMYNNYYSVVVTLLLRFVLLLILVFAKDLGKRNTWIVFGIYVAIELIAGIIAPSSSTIAAYRLISSVTRLVMVSIIGLCIKGKFDDKDQRGTV